MELSFGNSRAILPDGVVDVGRIATNDGLIVSLERDHGGGSVAFENLLVWPGFIDVHTHGAVGVDVNSADASGLMKIAEFLAGNGVTAWMPTVVPDTDDNYARAIEAINEAMRLQVDRPVAQAVGVHYEGVFANEAMCGALRPEYFRTFVGTHPKNHPVGEAPTPLLRKEGSLIDLPRLDEGVHMTTLAPEVDGGIELVKALVAEGWIVSIGHTRADFDTLERSFAAGARHLTHFFNAMTGIHHREAGVAGWGLVNEDMTFDIIADGIHVAPQMLEMACRVKSPEKVALISDSVAPTGLGDGEYELWGEMISVTNGRTKNARGSIAGSVITIHEAVKQMRALDFSEVDVAKMASSNPARLLGLDDKRGSIEVGKRADLVGIDANGEIAFTMVGGVLSEPPA